MVFNQNKSKADAAYLDTTSSFKSSTSSSHKADIKKLIDYFAVFDGSQEAAKRFQQAFRNTFHPDVIIELPGNNLDYAAAIECIQAGIDKGGRADLLDVVENDDGTATMTICNNVPGLKDDVTRQVAYFKEGKVIRVHAVEQDAAQFGHMVSHYQRCIPSKDSKKNIDAVASRWADMIACFDGSPDAYAKALPIIDEIFSPELIISTGEGQKDFQWFKEWAESYSKQQNSASVEHLQATTTGIRVAVRNIVDGADQGPVAQLGRIEDGKITYWSADLDSKDEAGFDRLVTSVAANQNGMVGNIQRLRDYLAALDGSPDAFGRFEPHIDRVLSKDIVWENGEGQRMDYDEIVKLFHDKYIPNGCYPVLEFVEVNDDGKSLTVVINNHLPGEDGDATRQVLYYGEDDLIYSLVSGPFYDTCQRVGSLPTKPRSRSPRLI